MPIYEFGFGLSYTSFSYSDLQLSRLDSKPYTPTTGLAGPAPDAESNSSTDYAQYLFHPPSEVPHYEGFVYPYLNDSDLAKASMDTDCGLPSNQYLPLESTSSTLQ